MRKFTIWLTSLVLLFTLAGFGQQVNYDFAKKYDVPTFTVDNDTSYTWPLTQSNKVWSFQYTWADLTHTDAYIVPYIMNGDTLTAIPYPNIDTLFLSSTSGSAILRDVGNGTAENFLKFVIESGSNTGGTLKTFGQINRKD